MTTLTDEQMRQYNEQGYVLVSGLVPDPVAQEAAAALWRRLDADPARPDTWAAISGAHRTYPDPALLACYTPALLAAAAEIAGDPVETITVPERAYTINVFPKPGAVWEWPHPHRKMEALARSDPERYEMMWALNQDLGRVDLGKPVELTPRGGDVLLYHYLCAHAGSSNTSSQPRLALNIKW